MKKILDVCCGSKMFWFNKNNPDVIFMDCRELEDTLCDGRKLEIKPDVTGDFRQIPFEDNSFYMVVFDPPHLLRIGETSYMAKKYGKLSDTWKEDISKGFDECMRVLKTNGTLIFKWNEEQIKLKDILSAISYEPLFGNRRAKTHWLVFMKKKRNENMRVSELFKMAKIICNENVGKCIDCPINEWCTDGIFSEGEEAAQQLESAILKNVKKS